jgi:hypothetical protein
MKNGLVFLGILIVILVLISGCSSLGLGQPKIVIKSSYKASGLDLLKNPVPFSVHFDAVNIGNADGNDVEADVVSSYGTSDIAIAREYFGTIKAGETKSIDDIIMVPLPHAYDQNTLKMRIGNIYINGQPVASSALS